MGDGLGVAETVTDAAGRYVLCGVKGLPTPAIAVTVVAGQAPFRPFFSRLTGTADVVIDIPLSK